jgi:hypothetical protein
LEINMKLVKSLLLGSAAGLCAVAGAQAADLPMRRAAPVEYVRVCTAYGAGFFYIPGTDTCLRVGGRARFEAQYTSNRAIGPNAGGSINNLVNGDSTGYRGLGRLNIDARTQTAYGTLRTFVRFEIAAQTGGYITSGTQQRFGTAFPALGQDTFGRAQTAVVLDKAFIQFAGFTAGRASSFFDFYAHDLEFIGATSGSDVTATNLFAYTFTFGNGFSATISAEDPIYRRQPGFSNQVFNGVSVIGGGQSFTNFGGVFTQSVPVAFSAVTGLPTAIANIDVIQRDRLPDFVGALRYDAPWGAAQVSGAVHELFLGKYTNSQAVTYDATGAPVFAAAAAAALAPKTQPSAEYGFGVQGGLKVNLPALAAGDVLWLQAAYSEGALSYAGIPLRFSGSENPTNTLTRFSAASNDFFVGADGKIKMTEAWSVTGSFLHYWTPEWRSAVFGSYSEVSFGKGARTGAGPANLIVAPGSAAANALAFNTTLRDYSVATVGANLIWSPVRDLDIGVETIYQRVDLKNGRATDGNKGALGVIAGVPNKTVKYDDVVATRFRVQRDF